MGLLCGCPPAASISNVTLYQCLDSFGQTQKFILQRTLKADGSRNSFKPNAAVTPTDPTLLAGWTPLLAAVDGTKVVQTPFVNEPTSEAGVARTYGGGNATLGGIEIIVGAEPTSFEGVFLNQNQKTIKQLKTFMCEELSLFYVDEYGRIKADSNGLGLEDEDLEIFGFPVQGFFIGDQKLGGLEEPDKNAIMFKHAPNWSDNSVVLVPTDFNALRDLITPA